jgi:hypothetical protein
MPQKLHIQWSGLLSQDFGGHRRALVSSSQSQGDISGQVSGQPHQTTRPLGGSVLLAYFQPQSVAAATLVTRSLYSTLGLTGEGGFESSFCHFLALNFDNLCRIQIYLWE